MDLKLSPAHIAVAAGLLVVLLVLVLLVLLVRRARAKARRRREQTAAALTASPPAEALSAPPTEPTPTHPPTFPPPPTSIRPPPEPAGAGQLDASQGPYRIVQDAGDRNRPAPQPQPNPRFAAGQERYRYSDPPRPRAETEPASDSAGKSTDHAPEAGPTESGEFVAQRGYPAYEQARWPGYPRPNSTGPDSTGPDSTGPGPGEPDGGFEAGHDEQDSYRGRYEPESPAPAGRNGLDAGAMPQQVWPEAKAASTEAARAEPGNDARDRLLHVLLADPARAVHAVGDLEASRTQLDRLNDSVHYQRRQLADAARRLRGAGLSPAQVAQLAGFGEGELVSLLAEHAPSPAPRPVGRTPEGY
ncbi:MAG TPA: hypothetical protein VGP05_24775 [Pseudonocardia sp.]|nr:hypothetical protein [Pseudonocardia sp.]